MYSITEREALEGGVPSVFVDETFLLKIAEITTWVHAMQAHPELFDDCAAELSRVARACGPWFGAVGFLADVDPSEWKAS
jgi:hypothetical protein